MATLQRYFPGGVNPDHYDPPIDGMDYMPMLGDLIELGTAVSITNSSSQVLAKFENGAQLKVIGTGFTFDSEGNATGGTVTGVQTLTAQGKLIDTITGLNLSAADFQSKVDDGSSWALQGWIFNGNDTLKGGAGDDDLFGHAGNDILKGGAGSDFLVGGEGKDTYDGGSGYDQISWDDGNSSSATHGVTVNAASHTATDPYGNVETFTNIESFRGTRFVDTMKGSSADEDFMGLAGKDKIDGGGGFDIVRYHRDVNRGGNDGVTVDLTKGYAIDGFGDRDTLKNIEGARGTQFADTLIGSAVDNYLRGDGGSDQLYGKAGNDKLQGGDGKDTFFFDTKLSTATNVDTIVDFVAADDTIRLDNAIFTKIAGTGALSNAQFYASASGKAHDADDRIIYNKLTGDLSYDADGNGKGAAVLFATLTDHPTVTSHDFFIY